MAIPLGGDFFFSLPLSLLSTCTMFFFLKKKHAMLREKVEIKGHCEQSKVFNTNPWVAISSSHFMTQYLELLHLKMLL